MVIRWFVGLSDAPNLNAVVYGSNAHLVPAAAVKHSSSPEFGVVGFVFVPLRTGTSEEQAVSDFEVWQVVLLMGALRNRCVANHSGVGHGVPQFGGYGVISIPQVPNYTTTKLASGSSDGCQNRYGRVRFVCTICECVLILFQL